MKPFLLLAIRAEDAAADNEYDSFLTLAGLDESELRRVRLEQRALGEVDLRDWSGILLGGGPFNYTDPEDLKTRAQRRVEADLSGLLDRVVSADFPFLGACYGIGALGRHQGAVVDRRFAEPVGAVEITLTAPGRRDPLFGELPATFEAFTGHKEAISRLPGHAVLLASSAACRVQAFRVGANVYATQFHPELDVAGLCTRVEVYKHAGYFAPDQADEIKAQAARSHVSWPPAILHGFFGRYGHGRQAQAGLTRGRSGAGHRGALACTPCWPAVRSAGGELHLAILREQDPGLAAARPGRATPSGADEGARALAGRPVLVLVDDLQYAGQSTVELMHFLGREPTGARLLVVATVRVENDTQIGAALAPVARRVEVGPLGPDAVAQLARAAGQGELASHILEQTRGHTLFVVEVLRALTSGDARVPESLRTAVLARVRRAGPPVEALLRAAAVLGATVDPLTVGVMLVEPYATDEVAGNMNPVGRAYYNFSTLLCVPNALSQSGGFALGAQAGEAAIRQVVTDAGFTRFRRAAETPFNLVYEVRP